MEREGPNESGKVKYGRSEPDLRNYQDTFSNMTEGGDLEL